MKLGATFPQTEIGSDPGAIREYAQAVEDMGFSYLMAYDHVLGANIERPDRQGRRWPYNHTSQFHEPFVLYGYLAAVTRRLQLVTGVIILPQRQAVLVAKQAAEVDVLSGGRLRLGVGLGWNEVEYEALGEDFHTRGDRIAEQVEMMRALWTQPLVTFHGRRHTITDAGLNPLPVQRPIPVWMGGYAEPVLRRVAALADGWVLSGPATSEIPGKLDRIREYARQAGRDPASIGFQAGIPVSAGGPERWRGELETLRRLGADYVSINTMGAGLQSVSEHIQALSKAKAELAM